MKSQLAPRNKLWGVIQGETHLAMLDGVGNLADSAARQVHQHQRPAGVDVKILSI